MIVSEPVREGKPGGAGAPADRAASDQPARIARAGFGEDSAQPGGGPKDAPVVVQAVDGLVDCCGDAAGATAWFHAAGGPEPLIAVLGLAPHIKDGGTRISDGVRHSDVASPQPGILAPGRIAGGGGRGRSAQCRSSRTSRHPACGASTRSSRSTASPIR